MPANIIKLEEVVPGLSGTTFQMPDGKSYHIPGDLSTETVFNLLALFEELVSFEEKSAAEMAKSGGSGSIAKVRNDLKAVTDRINEELLAIFRLSDPDLEVLPFGSQTTAVVLAEVFKAMGLAGDGGIEADPPKPRIGAGRKPTTRRSSRTAASQKGRKAK